MDNGTVYYCTSGAPNPPLPCISRPSFNISVEIFLQPMSELKTLRKIFTKKNQG